MKEVSVTLFEFSRSNRVLRRDQSHVPVYTKELELVDAISRHMMMPTDTVEIEHWPIMVLNQAVRTDGSPRADNLKTLKRTYPDLVWEPSRESDHAGMPVTIYQARIAIDYKFYRLIEMHIEGTLANERHKMEARVSAAKERENSWKSEHKTLSDSIEAFKAKPWYARVWAALKGDICGL